MSLHWPAKIPSFIHYRKYLTLDPMIEALGVILQAYMVNIFRPSAFEHY